MFFVVEYVDERGDFIMNKENLTKVVKRLGCVLLAGTFVAAIQVSAKEKTNETEENEEHYSASDALDAYNLLKEDGATNYDYDEDDLKVGCYVKVSGRGNESSDGSGKLGYEWKNKDMMIVGVRENAEFPYACAIISENPSSKDTMAWFKAENLGFTVKNIESRLYVGDDNKVPVGYQKSDGIPAGYQVDGDFATKITRVCPYYSDDSKEEIAKTYRISLEK